jgi:hypothetical protein
VRIIAASGPIRKTGTRFVPRSSSVGLHARFVLSYLDRGHHRRGAGHRAVRDTKRLATDNQGGAASRKIAGRSSTSTGHRTAINSGEQCLIDA